MQHLHVCKEPLDIYIYIHVYYISKNIDVNDSNAPSWDFPLLLNFQSPFKENIQTIYVEVLDTFGWKNRTIVLKGLSSSSSI